MKENRYDDLEFFTKYSQMPRSVGGLAAAGEWPAFRRMLPSLSGKRVLDLGCGFGWHCRYAVSQGAQNVLGIDISERMLSKARSLTEPAAPISYRQMPIEDIDFSPGSFDVVISSLAFHYLESFTGLCEKIYHSLSPGGDLIFSAEHPIFTSSENQDWFFQGDQRVHWPVDNYFQAGPRRTRFLAEEVIKYHRPLTTYLASLLNVGFKITGFVEPEPDPQLLQAHPEMADERRRPMFFIVSARK
jgi:SAM-dependent methyltransferase